MRPRQSSLGLGLRWTQGRLCAHPSGPLAGPRVEPSSEADPRAHWPLETVSDLHVTLCFAEARSAPGCREMREDTFPGRRKCPGDRALGGARSSLLPVTLQARPLQLGEGRGPGLAQDTGATPPLCHVQSSGRVSGQTMGPHVLPWSPTEGRGGVCPSSTRTSGLEQNREAAVTSGSVRAWVLRSWGLPVSASVVPRHPGGRPAEAPAASTTHPPAFSGALSCRWAPLPPRPAQAQIYEHREVLLSPATKSQGGSSGRSTRGHITKRA